jgi:phage shock protein C
MEKRFYRSRTDKKLAGVCAGIASYFEIDPTLVRLIWIVFTFAGGAGLLAYIIAAIVMPEEPDQPQQKIYRQTPHDHTAEIVEVDEQMEDDSQDAGQSNGESAEYMMNELINEKNHKNESSSDRNNITLGLILILIGAIFFSRNFFRWFWIDFSYIWPIVLILIGVVMIINKRK